MVVAAMRAIHPLIDIIQPLIYLKIHVILNLLKLVLARLSILSTLIIDIF